MEALLLALGLAIFMVSDRSWAAERQVMVNPVAAIGVAGWIVDVEIAGNHAYVSSGEEGFHVLDIRDPSRPVRLGGFNTAGFTEAVRVSGHHAFVADRGPGLQVFDVGNPAIPARVGGILTGSGALGLRISGTNAFVAAGDSGVFIVDISDPARPVRTGSLITPGTAYDLALDGTKAYVAAGTQGLQILDVSDRTRPVLLGGLLGFMVEGVAIYGHYAVLGATIGSIAGIVVVDVSNPTQPVRVGFAWHPNSIPSDRRLGPLGANDVKIVGSYALVSMGPSGMRVFDLSQPHHPTYAGGYPTTGSSVGLGIAGNHVWVADFNARVQVLQFHVGLPQTLTWTGASDIVVPWNIPVKASASASSGLPVNMRVQAGPATLEDGMLTVTGPGTVHVEVVQPGNDIHLPARITRTLNRKAASVTRMGTADPKVADSGPIEVAGDLAFLIDRGTRTEHGPVGASLRVLDVRNPSEPRQVGQLEIGHTIQGLRADGDFVYLADLEWGLHVVNVSDPTRPIRVGGWGMPGRAVDVAVYRNHAYVAEENGGVQVLDVSNPGKVIRLGALSGLSTRAHVRRIEVVGSLAYLIDRNESFDPSQTFRIVDLSTPAAPVVIGSLGLPSNASDFRVSGTVAAISTGGAAGNLYLHFVDVSTPSLPMQVGSTSGIGHLIGFHGNLLSMIHRTLDEPKIAVLDISDPQSAPFVHVGGLPASFRFTTVAGDRIWVSGDGRLDVLQLERRYLQSIQWTGTTESELPPGSSTALGASISTELPLELKVEFGPAEIRNGLLKVLGPGLIQVTAQQAGNADYFPISETRSFNGWTLSAQWASHLPMGEAQDIAVVGRYAYVPDLGDYQYETESYANSGLRVIDVANPTQPIQVGHLITNLALTSIAVEGGHAFVGDGGFHVPGNGWSGGGLSVFDIRNPSKPELVGRHDLNVKVNHVHAESGVAWIASLTNFQTFDISTPSNPVPVGTPAESKDYNSFAKVGNHLYRADRTHLRVFDVSHPTSPRELGSVDLYPILIETMDVAGAYAYVAGGEDLAVVDISDPTLPRRVGGVSGLLRIQDLQVVGEVAYLVGYGLSSDAGTTGLRALDLRNPIHPVATGGWFPMLGAAWRWRLAVAEGHAYIAGGRFLAILDLKMGPPSPAPGARFPPIHR